MKKTFQAGSVSQSSYNKMSSNISSLAIFSGGNCRCFAYWHTCTYQIVVMP